MKQKRGMMMQLQLQYVFYCMLVFKSNLVLVHHLSHVAGGTPRGPSPGESVPVKSCSSQKRMCCKTVCSSAEPSFTSTQGQVAQ